MAYDKVVDSTVLNAGLTTIANAIREKGGTSETLDFPDGMAEAIAAIETGNLIVALSGTFIITETSRQYYEVTFDTPLSVRPKLVLCHSCNYNDASLYTPTFYGFQLAIGYMDSRWSRTNGAIAWTSSDGWKSGAVIHDVSLWATETGFRIHPNALNVAAAFQVGEEYRWLLFCDLNLCD